MLNIAVTGSGGFIGKKLMGLREKELNFFPLDTRKLIAGEASHDAPLMPDHVIHLAAKTFVPDSWKTPGEFYQVNVMGTQAVLDYCRQHHCGMTYISSYVYGVPEHLPINEEHPVAPNTPYNHSKLMGEELCEFYHRYFNLDIAVLRPFNIYGPGQDSSFLIPRIIEQALNENRIELQNLDPKRDYLYIDDFIDALLATINFKGFGKFNLGSGISVSVREVAEQIRELSEQQHKQIIASGPIRENELILLNSERNSGGSKKLRWKKD
jgi:nucleoside-diphosphate-sugar epimerase